MNRQPDITGRTVGGMFSIGAITLDFGSGASGDEFSVRVYFEPGRGMLVSTWFDLDGFMCITVDPDRINPRTTDFTVSVPQC